MNNWQTKKLGDIAEISGGGTPPTSHTEYFSGDIPWFTPSEITSGTVSVLNNSQRQITEEAMRFTKVAEQGTVLLSSRATIGNIGIVSSRSTYNQGIKGITPKEELNHWYLAYWLLANKKRLEQSSHGTTFKELSATALKRFDIVIPPLSIQQQITEKLDAIRKLQELNNKEVEKAEELFDSSLASLLKPKDNWQIKKLEEVAEILMGQSPPSNTYNTTGEGLPFFQGKADFNDVYPTVSKHCSKPVRIAQKDDVLLSVRAPVGPVNLAPSEICIGRGLSSIRGKENVLNQMYLFYFMKLSEIALVKKGTGSTFSSINRRDIEKINLPLPSFSIQQQIVEKLNAIRKLQELKKLEKEKLSKLFESMLNKAMKGELIN